MAQDGDGMPPLTDLASSDSKLRRRSQNDLFTYLSSSTRQPLTTTPTLQLWRALIVTLLMHDSKNALSVQKLTSTIASQFVVISDRDDDLASASTKSHPTNDHSHTDPPTADPAELPLFTSAFWQTISREWSTVDSHRINKILLLIRFVLRNSFDVLFADAVSSTTAITTPNDDPNPTQKPRLSSQLQLLSDWPLSPRERKVPDGLRYHVLDIYVDELQGAQQRASSLSSTTQIEHQTHQGNESETQHHNHNHENNDNRKKCEDLIQILLQRIETVAKEGLSKGVRTRAKDVLVDAREKFSGLAV